MVVGGEPPRERMVVGAEPASEIMVDGRTLPVAKFCQGRRWVANGKQGKYVNDTFFMIGDYEDDQACDLRLYQMSADYLCDLDGYGETYCGNPLGYIDSGSTSHLCPHLELFNNLSEFKSSIVLPNKSKMVELGIGRVGALTDVLYVPDLERVIISTGKLDTAGYKIVMFGGTLEAYDEVGDLAFTGTLMNGMYHLDPVEKMAERLNAINLSEGSAPRKFKTAIGSMTPLDYLHHRWGHPTEKVIKEGIRRGSVNGTLVDEALVTRENLSFCPDCLRGKMSDLPETSSETDYSNCGPLDLVATDSKGPFSTQSHFGHYKYFDLFSYKTSQWMSVRFKKTKDEVYKNVLDEINQIGAYGYQIKHLQTDDDSLYRSDQMKKIISDYGINKRTTVPYHHSSNGWIERQVRTVMEKARTIMLIYDCPLMFWPEAISCAAYLYNVTPTSVLDWKTPYCIVFGSKPDISHLVPFYAPGIVYLSAEERGNQFSPKGLSCRMLGYDPESKNGYCLYS
jgi:hypothetical protein